MAFIYFETSRQTNGDRRMQRSGGGALFDGGFHCVPNKWNRLNILFESINCTLAHNTVSE